MPPDGEHLSRRAKMYQRSPPRGRRHVASSTAEPETTRKEGKGREHRPIKASRRVRDLVIAILAVLSVSYLVSSFRPTPDLFGTSLTVLEQHQQGLPSVESYLRSSISSDNVLQVVNTRYVSLSVLPFDDHHSVSRHE